MTNTGTTGTVTLVAAKVELSSSANILQASYHTPSENVGILVFATSTSNEAIKVAGNDQELTGLLFAPYGGAALEGLSANFTITDGGVHADTVKISGDDFSMSAPYTSEGSKEVALIE